MTDAILIGCTVVALVLIVTAIVLAERARKRNLERGLAALGLTVNFDPTASDKAQALDACGSLWSDLRTGASGVQWVASGTIDGLAVSLLEHRYTSGSGKNKSVHYHTVAATPAPPNWPSVTLTRENIFHRIGELFGSRDFKLDDVEFNKRWRVKVQNEEFAIMALTPEVQSWAMKLGKSSIVRIGGGGISVGVPRSTRAVEAVGLARSAAQLALLIPPELGEWESPPPSETT